MATCKKDTRPNPHLSPPHMSTSFSPGKHCTDTENARVDVRPCKQVGALCREVLLDTKKLLEVALRALR